MKYAIGKRDHEYILSPVSATACIKRNLSEAPLRSRSTPRLICDLKLDKFPLSLSDAQYRQLAKCNKEYDRLEKARHYRKWRPSCRVKDNVYSWWQYPIQCHLDKIHKKYSCRNWPAALERARDIVKYVRIYCEHLKNPATVTTDNKAHKLKVEHLMNFGDLCALREIAMMRVAKEHEGLEHTRPLHPPSTTSSEPTSPTQSGEGILQRWFPTWGGWYASDTTTTPTSSPSEDDTAEDFTTDVDVESQAIPESRAEEEEKKVAGSLEEEILYVLSDTVENDTYMKRDAVFCQLSFMLKQCSFSLSSTRPVTTTEERDKR